MQSRSLFAALVAIACTGISISCGSVHANTRNSFTETTSQGVSGRLSKVFAFSTHADATYSTASGALEPMPDTSVSANLTAPGPLVITFSARGSVVPTNTTVVPIVFIQCEIDGQPCDGDVNTVEFLYPQFCCDTRSYQWVVANAQPGTHKIEIYWGMGNPTSAVVTNRSLVVVSAAAD